MFDLGDGVPLTYPSYPAGATGAQLTITLPDASTFTTATAGASYTYVPTQIGRHVVRWVANGATADAYVDAFDVAPGDLGSIISLADLKAALRVPSNVTTNDEELRQVLAATTDVVENIAGRLVVRSYTETHNGGHPWVVLRQAPVVAVQSVVEYLGATAYPLTEQPYGAAVDPFGFTVELDTGRIVRRGPQSWAQPFLNGQRNVVVTYTAGRRVIPAAVQLAARIIAGYLWSIRRGPQSSARPAVPTDDVPGTGYQVPREALELLAGYQNVPGLA